MSELITPSIKLVKDGLSLGDHDSITLLGASSQGKLRDCANRISKLLLVSNGDLEDKLSGILTELDKFQSLDLSAPRIMFWSKDTRHNKVRQKYNTILSYLDGVTLYFQLQQAQLIKENKLLESLAGVISDSISELDSCIEEGINYLPFTKDTHPEVDFRGMPVDWASDPTWETRLKKRVEDLRISRLMALQNQAQIKQLHESNIILIDQIATTVSNLIPAWQTQMSILLGVELMEQRLSVQNKLLQITDTHVKKASRQTHKTYTLSEIEEMQALNQKLIAALSEIDRMEKSDKTIRNSFQKKLFREDYSL